MNRTISALGLLLLGIAACLWVVSQWRTQAIRAQIQIREQALRAQGQIQEQMLKERALNEQREQQQAKLSARAACDVEARQQALEQYQRTHPKYVDKIIQEPNGSVSVIPNGQEMHNDDVFLREDYEIYYQQCVRLVGAE